MLERKIRYDRSVVEYVCRLLHRDDRQAVLRYEITSPFSIPAGAADLLIPAGSFTVAYYWIDKPYNVYMWRDSSGRYLGSYFNIVKNTSFSEAAVTFEDLIVDVLVLPDGSRFILDEDELPQPLAIFENGSVHRALTSLIGSVNELLSDLMRDTVIREYHMTPAAGSQ
jgi:predicted RNA-binding protein associated with RNAse of E/G family